MPILRRKQAIGVDTVRGKLRGIVAGEPDSTKQHDSVGIGNLARMSFSNIEPASVQQVLGCNIQREMSLLRRWRIWHQPYFFVDAGHGTAAVSPRGPRYHEECLNAPSNACFAVKGSSCGTATTVWRVEGATTPRNVDRVDIAKLERGAGFLRYACRLPGVRFDD